MLCAGGTRSTCFCSRHPVFAPGSSKGAVGFFGLFVSFGSRICPSWACSQLFLVPYSFFVFCSPGEVCPGASICSKGSQIPACLMTKSHTVGDKSPHPTEFLALEQLHFTHELTNTLTSASEVKLNIEAILAGYCYFSALSYSNCLFCFYFRVFIEQAMFGFQLQRDVGRQRAHST